MLKKTITYTDYNEVERTEDFYFNLTKAELIEMDLLQDGGMETYLTQLINAKEAASIMKIFKEILYKSYGEKSLDGKRFVKSQELSEAFSQTEAYNILFTELVSSEEVAAAFINGIIPEIPADGSNPKPQVKGTLPTPTPQAEIAGATN